MSDENCDRAFEIIGVYYANCYWNRHYKTASDTVKDGKYLDIQEAYKTTVERYNRAFGRMENPDERINPGYKDVIEDLTKYYEGQINRMRALENKEMTVRISYRDFVDTITGHLLPKDEYEGMLKYDNKKEKSFRKILTTTVAKFTMFVIRSGITDVIDKQVRTNKELAHRYLRGWSDKFTEILTEERNDFCNLILASRSGIDVNKENMSSVPKMVVDRMQDDIKELLEENNTLRQTINKHVDFIGALKKVIVEYKGKNDKLEKAVRKLSKKISEISVSAPVPVPVPEPAPAPVPIKSRKPRDPVQDLRDAEFSGEEYHKEPERGDYLEEAGSSSEEGTESGSESGSASESGESSLASGDELSADD
jgi:hypothetical protein